MTDSNSILCNTCQLPIPEASPGGICPRCLLREGIETEKSRDTLNAETETTSPSSQRNQAPSAPSKEDLAKWFPQLEVFEMLGSGGMGRVYKARQTHLDRVVALKILSGSPESLEAFALRFEQEAKLLARLHHPNIVTLFDFGVVKRDDGALPLYFFLMEYVEGSNLQDCISSEEISPDHAFRITAEICEALQFAHDHGVMHRDIKPANILLSSSNNVKLADFGIAKIISVNREGKETGITVTGTSIGTPFYMAPEMWEEPEQADQRADIYSLGAVLYHMLTGDSPSGRFNRPSIKKNLPRLVDAPIWKALAKNPDDRYADAKSFGKDAAKISAQLNRAHRSSHNRIFLLAAIAIVGVILAIWNPLDSSDPQFSPESVPPSNAETESPPTSPQGRVYLHYAGTEQKTRLEPTTRILDDANFTLVYSRDIQSREELPISTEIRYFREPQEKAGAEGVLSLLKNSDGFEDIRLLYVAGYGDANRENHFEIWLGQNFFANKKSIGRELREQSRERKSGYLRMAKSPNTSRIDISKAEKFSDIVAVRCTESHWYALRNNGSLISSNQNHDRLYIDSISGGQDRPIALVETGGEIEILGKDAFFSPSEYPASLKNRIAVACEVGSGHALALLENGEIAAWGPRYDREMRAPEVTPEKASIRWLQPPILENNNIAIAVTSTYAATLQANGEVSIWGPRGAIVPAGLESHFPIQSIQSAGDDFLLLSSSGNVIRIIIPFPIERKAPLLLRVAEDASMISSHFYYAEGKGWQSISMPKNSTGLWKTCSQVGTGQIIGYTTSSADSPENQSVIMWVEPKKDS